MQRDSEAAPSSTAVDGRRSTAVAIVASVVSAGTVIALAFALITDMGDGDRLASRKAEHLMQAVGGGIDLLGAHARPADYLAAQLLTADLGYDVSSGERVHVGILNWAGDSGDPDGARIDVRLIYDVDGVYGKGMFSRSQGVSIRCWRLVVFAGSRDAGPNLTGIRCPLSADRVPHPPPLPALPPDCVARLTAVLAAATPASLDDLARSSFAEGSLTVQTLATHGVLYAAVGVPNERSCLVGTRRADGTVQVDVGDLEAYEPSCSTDLFFEPTLGGD